MKAIVLFTMLCLLVVFSCQPVRLPLEVISPNGNVKAVFTVNEAGSPVYSVWYKDSQIITESPLSLVFQQDGEWGAQVSVEKKKMRVVQETYDLGVGKSNTATNHCKEMLIELVEDEAPQRQVNILFRAYDDGVAFRYAIPRQESLQEFELVAENSEFRFANNADCWALELGRFTSNYETEFTPTTINDIAGDALVGLPLTIEMKEGPTVAVTEADLTDYAGMYLNGAETENALISVLSHLPGDEVCVKAQTPFASPWRVIMIGDTPGDLVKSNLVLNLNDPPALDDPGWIKAGKVAWDWWSGQVVDDPDIESGMNNETMKHYIDFAAENGLEYMLVDAGWYGHHRSGEADITQTIPEIDMPGLVQYAKERNVDILIWLNWRAVARQMDEAFPLYEEWGVKGVKIDYMDRDDQEMVNFYHNTVKKAAEHHLLVDFHGAYKPTGIRRTYPNLMTREGVLGLEYLKWSNRATAEHNTIIPFTRMLAGPMDYTPGGFRNVTMEEFAARGENPMVPTTRCHQLALFVVFESPLQMVSDAPANYRNQPGLDFLQTVPASWDETLVLAGDIGDYAAIARKSGETWYLGAITDDQPRSLELPLDFLPEGEFELTMWSDGPGTDRNPKRLVKSQTTVTSEDKLDVEMVGSGGMAAQLRPVM